MTHVATSAEYTNVADTVLTQSTLTEDWLSVVIGLIVVARVKIIRASTRRIRADSPTMRPIFRVTNHRITLTRLRADRTSKRS
jgi:hypothetical protein